MVSGVTPRPVRYSRAMAAAGKWRLASKYWVAASWRSINWRRMPASAASWGAGELAFRERDAGLLGDRADGLRKGEMEVHLHDEGEDVTLLMAAEAVEVGVRGVDREGAGLLLVEGAEAGVVLGAGFAQLDVVADDLDDVDLRLDGLGEVVGHGFKVKFRGSRLVGPPVNS